MSIFKIFLQVKDPQTSKQQSWGDRCIIESSLSHMRKALSSFVNDGAVLRDISVSARHDYERAIEEQGAGAVYVELTYNSYFKEFDLLLCAPGFMSQRTFSTEGDDSRIDLKKVLASRAGAGIQGTTQAFLRDAIEKWEKAQGETKEEPAVEPAS